MCFQNRKKKWSKIPTFCLFFVVVVVDQCSFWSILSTEKQTVLLIHIFIIIYYNRDLYSSFFSSFVFTVVSIIIDGRRRKKFAVYLLSWQRQKVYYTQPQIQSGGCFFGLVCSEIFNCSCVACQCWFLMPST